MIGKIVGAILGERIASRYGTGAKGALIGEAAPVLARRFFGPLGLVVAGAYAAKKLYDWRKNRAPAKVPF